MSHRDRAIRNVLHGTARPGQLLTAGPVGPLEFKKRTTRIMISHDVMIVNEINDNFRISPMMQSADTHVLYTDIAPHLETAKSSRSANKILLRPLKFEH
jgi:hypothetical protein